MDLFGSVVAAFEIVLFRTFDLICRIGGDQVDLDRILQSFVDICVIVDHGVWLDPLQLLGVEIL